MKVDAEHQPGAGQPDATELLRVLDAGLSAGLLERALTHRSFAYENGGLPTNERLEFLGDSVLGVVVTDALFRGYPDLPEGHLAKLRAAVVNMRALASVARGHKLGDYVRLGRGEDGYSLDGDLLDLEPVLRDALVLALPLAPRCQEDCPGLCVECGVRLAQAGPGHHHGPALDPRWAALRQITMQAGPDSASVPEIGEENGRGRP